VSEARCALGESGAPLAPRPAVGDTDDMARVNGAWIFVLIEAAIFGSYFVTYMIRRMAAPEQFLNSQALLSQDFGVVNTLILLLSSWFVARCVLAARQGERARASTMLVLTMGAGGVFVASKLIEWSIEIGRGLTLTTNEFFSFYYFLTGIHVLHVLIGLIFLSVAWLQLRETTPRASPAVEVGALVWHMIDFLWVMIFALVYVMR
jgi:nitric oxide reductase NorE protein